MANYSMKSKILPISIFAYVCYKIASTVSDNLSEEKFAALAHENSSPKSEINISQKDQMNLSTEMKADIFDNISSVSSTISSEQNLGDILDEI